MSQSVYTVQEVNKFIKNMFLQERMLGNICIKGEISAVKYHTTGHIYFTLKDASGVIPAVMYKGNRPTGLNFPMKVGDKVLVTGKIDVYERDGKYELYARKIELDGEGNLFLRFEQLKRELEEMGMFAIEYKRPIPKYARRIGVVTAPTGAAIQDIRNIARRRNPYVEIILCPALVQGEGAALSIVNGIRALEALGVDVMIVGRGGGSIEDLWAFNEEIVARAIFDCSVPIISAVGHETDWTIADLVADRREPTPSAAAECAVFSYADASTRLQQYSYDMTHSLDARLRHAKVVLENYKLKLSYKNPKAMLEEHRRRLVDIEEALTTCMEQMLKDKKHQLAIYANSMEANSPLKKLSQGYGFVEDASRKGVKSCATVSAGDTIYVSLVDGTIETMVQNVEVTAGDVRGKKE